MISSSRHAIAAVAIAVTLLCPRPAAAYSVLAHEAMVDAVWEQHIVPLLQSRFPGLTPEAVLQARAYAYGGSVIQDLGYYPFGNKLFSNLVHYVRSGDFVEALIDDARDANELAFAVGALGHYASDNAGHPLGTNKVVPIVYPKLRAEFGDEVLYAHSPARHVMVEFSFDVLQVASGTYTADAYKSFIGFSVAEELLERAFIATYGLELDDLFLDVDLAIGTYRHAVGTMIPEVTRLAWEDKQDEIRQRTPAIEQNAFVYTLSRQDYDRTYGTQYKKPSVFTRLIFALLKILPKIGPLRPLAFSPLTPEAARLFTASFTASLERYRTLLSSTTAPAAAGNTDLDTGRAPDGHENPLVEETYADLVDKLAAAKAPVPDELRAELTRHYRTGVETGLTRGERRMIEKARAKLAGIKR